MPTVTCPDCDEKVTLRPGRTSAKCPACGGSVSADTPAAKGSRRSDDDDDRKEKAEKKKPKRKYREDWDDDDDDDDRRKPPPKPKGSLAWLWILLGVLAFVLAGCGGAVWWAVSSVKKVKDDFVQQANDAHQGQVVDPWDVNKPTRPKPPFQQNAAAYPKRKPFDVDPQLLAKPSPVYLDDLDPFDVRQGDWPVGRHGALGFEDRWVQVNKAYYEHGIGMIPPNNGAARMNFATGGQARRLKGQVALNDYWHDGDAHAFVTFAIYKDGKEVWRSQPMKSKNRPEAFDVDVSGARVVMIETNAPDSAHDAHCVWLDPVLVK